MLNTLLRIHGLLQSEYGEDPLPTRLVTVDGVRYDTATQTRVPCQFIRYILNALLVHYQRNNNRPLSAAVNTLLQSDHFNNMDHIIMNKISDYNNPSIDTISYLEETYENITSNAVATTARNTRCKQAAYLIRTDLFDDHVASYGGLILYPSRWDQVNMTGAGTFPLPTQFSPGTAL